MKLRIKKDSLRWRLSKAEVASLCQSGYIEQQTNFAGNKFISGVKAREDMKTLSASFTDSRIELLVPAAWLQGWVSNDKVGFETNMPVGADQFLHLLLEKDFKCLDAAIEDQSDNYENPKLQHTG